MDNEAGLTSFREITKEDITANGKLRPIGARHFSEQQIALSNMIQVFNTQLGQLIQPHTSSVALSKFVESSTNTEKHGIFQTNIKVYEDQETASIVGTAKDVLEEQQVAGA